MSRYDWDKPIEGQGFWWYWGRTIVYAMFIVTQLILTGVIIYVRWVA